MNYKVINNICNINNYYIIDLRKETEYNLFHVVNAVNIEVKNINKLCINKNTNILLYCNTGVSVRDAINILYNMNYRNLFIYKTGSINCFENIYII